ncbi:MAG: adenosylmethionine decarboxylase [Pseudomonadales bacterium]|jgi:S-adenosylmethionine decarboxylase|nr:adenosylmethionine decarboxylase [Pseudomonadales bacterium]MBL6808561.1 adenosylmethionine decarboxylase [Pseudomonadales bacterium]
MRAEAAWVGRGNAVPHDPGPEINTGTFTPEDGRLDHFIKADDGVHFAGTHLIIDFFGAKELDNLELMETALRRAVKVSGATLLHIHLHHFTPNGGISGVAVLAESHISVHTWPECGYAAFDIFMCGDAKPMLGAEALRKTFAPERHEIGEHRRGVIDDA